MNHQPRKSVDNLQVLTPADVRRCLQEIREKKNTDNERRKGEWREQLLAEEPRSFQELYRERVQEVRVKALQAAPFTDGERRNLDQYAKEKKSWNPWTRATAIRAERVLLTAHEQRQQESVRVAFEHFLAYEVEEMHVACREAEQEYLQYEQDTCSWEERLDSEFRELGWQISEVEERLRAIERMGIKTIELIGNDADIARIEDAVQREYMKIPIAIRQSIYFEKEPRELLGRDR